jgi:hypothetical protein
MAFVTETESDKPGRGHAAGVAPPLPLIANWASAYSDAPLFAPAQRNDNSMTMLDHHQPPPLGNTP